LACGRSTPKGEKWIPKKVSKKRKTRFSKKKWWCAKERKPSQRTNKKKSPGRKITVEKNRRWPEEDKTSSWGRSVKKHTAPHGGQTKRNLQENAKRPIWIDVKKGETFRESKSLV